MTGLYPPQNVAIDITPFGQARLHRHSFRVVVPRDATESEVWTALQRLARRKSSWLAWLGIGFSYDEILFGSRSVSNTNDPVTAWALR